MIYEMILGLISSGHVDKAKKYIEPAHEQGKITDEQYAFINDILKDEEEMLRAKLRSN